jgi:hypothetical protein
MNPTTLLRPPLVFLVLAEAALVAILGAVTWHVWQDRFGPGSAAVAAQPAGPLPATRPPATTTRRPGLPASPSPLASHLPPTPQAGPTPGTRTDASFLSREMAELNRVEQTFEDLEWRVTKAVADGIERYLEGVVLPSIERGESGR